MNCNCMFFGDYLEDFDFCLRECPQVERCTEAQDLVVPDIAWDVARMVCIREHFRNRLKTFAWDCRVKAHRK